MTRPFLPIPRHWLDTRHPLWSGGRARGGRLLDLWLYLYCQARHQAGEHRGEWLDVGQVRVSLAELQDRLGLSKSRASRLLQRLADGVGDCQIIALGERTQHGTLYRIDQYQQHAAPWRRGLTEPFAETPGDSLGESIRIQGFPAKKPSIPSAGHPAEPLSETIAGSPADTPLNAVEDAVEDSAEDAAAAADALEEWLWSLRTAWPHDLGRRERELVDRWRRQAIDLDWLVELIQRRKHDGVGSLLYFDKVVADVWDPESHRESADGGAFASMLLEPPSPEDVTTPEDWPAIQQALVGMAGDDAALYLGPVVADRADVNTIVLHVPSDVHAAQIEEWLGEWRGDLPPGFIAPGPSFRFELWRRRDG